MADRLAPGTLLEGRYEIIGIIGEGGMGAVYRAVDRRLNGKPWAIKEVSPEVSGGPADPTPQNVTDPSVQLKQEASLLAQLEHANLPRVADFFEHAGRYYLVMELVVGKTLEALVLEKGPAPPARGLHLAWQLCDILEYLHAQKPRAIIFRDLKPGNVMVTADGKVKLIDFGIARLFSPAASKDTVALGTPGFAAPEQYGAGQSDERTDVYGLGATLHFALTGYDPQPHPFVFPRASKLNPGVSENVAAALEKALSMEPEKRFATVAEFRAALKGRTGEWQPLERRSRPLTSPLPPVQESAAPTRLLPPDAQLLRPSGPALPGVVPGVDFGTVTRNAARSVFLQLPPRARVRTNRSWLRVQRRGGQWSLELEPGRIPQRGAHEGMVTVQSGRTLQNVPVTVNLQTEPAGPFLYLAALLFTICTVIPAIGVFSFLWFSGIYLSKHSDIRRDLSGFFTVATFLATVNILVSASVWYFYRDFIHPYLNPHL